MAKKFIGKLLRFKFAGRKYDITGVVLEYNEDWTLVRRCYDHAFNGYTLFKNEKVDFYYGESEKITTQILKVKKYSFKEKPVIKLDSLDNMLQSISKKYGLIEIDTRKGDALDVGKYVGHRSNLYVLNGLSPTAKWSGKLKLKERECQFLSFNTQYINDLKLITKFK